MKIPFHSTSRLTLDFVNIPVTPYPNLPFVLFPFFSIPLFDFIFHFILGLWALVCML